MVVVGEADAARVHVVAVTEAAGPLLVCMATGEQRLLDVLERLAEGSLLHPRPDDLVARPRRSVESEQRATAA